MVDLIPIQRQVGPSVRPRNRVAANAFQNADPAGGLAEVAQAGAQLALTVDRKEQERLERERQTKLGALRNQQRQQSTLGLLEDFNNAKNEIQPGADGFYDDFKKNAIAKRREQVLAAAGDDAETKRVLAEDYDRLALPVLADAQEFQAAERVRHRTDVLQGSLQSLGNAIVSSPDRFNAFYAEGLDSINNASSDLSPKGRAALLESWQESASMAAFNGMLEADPYQALEDAQSKRFDRHWSPEVKASAINKAQSEIKRREAEQRAMHAEHMQRLGRQVDGAIKVMEAGFEYRDLDKLKAAVKGTELEPEIAFHESVAQVRQDHALRPVAEQIEILRQVEDQPQTEGSLAMIKALRPVTEGAAKAVQSDRVLDYAAQHGVVALEPIEYEDPDSWGNRLRRSDAAAQMAGVDRANVLTDAEHGQLIEFVASMPAPEKIQWMAGLRAGLDDHDYRQVQRAMTKAKVEPGLALASDMIARSEKNQAAAQRLMQAFAVDEKALPLESDAKKLAQDEARSEFNDGLGAVLSAQADVLSSDAGRLNMMAEMHEATRRLALSYAATGRGGGWFDGNAGGEAYNDLFGDYQSVTDNDAILFAEEAVGDLDDVASGLRRLRRERAADLLAWQRPLFIQQHGERRGPALFDEYVQDIQDDGVWVNGAGGAVLVDPVQGSAIAMPDGTPVVVTFEEALEANEGRVPSLAEAMRGGTIGAVSP
ncbi:MAG: hypothetical protein ACR2QF_07810 [Geminicoccaceae bacterium]